MTEAPGFMIILLNGRRFFVETENWPGERGQHIEVDGDKIFELYIMPKGPDQLQCTSVRLEKSPFKTVWIKIPVSAVASIEKVSAESFVWQSVYMAKSNLVLPNVQEIQQGTKEQAIREHGRQKFRKVK